MYVVYWSTVVEGNLSPNAVAFGTEDMGKAIATTESLRARAKGGESIRFISLVSEHPDCVGQMGVDVTGPDYNWTKRRDT